LYIQYEWTYKLEILVMGDTITSTNSLEWKESFSL